MLLFWIFLTFAILTLAVAWRHGWDWPATVTALAAAGAAIWQALENLWVAS